MNAENKTPRVTYAADFKRKAVDLVKKGQSVSDVCKKLGIQNKKTLENWIVRHEKGVLQGPKEGRRDNLSVVALQNALLQVLPDYPEGISAATIRDRLDEEHGIFKSEKTIQRHIEVLSDERGGYKVTPGAGGGWCRNKNIKPALRLNELSVADALSLSLLERFLKPLLPKTTTSLLETVFDQARRKLEQEARTNKLAAWSNKVAVAEPGLDVIPPEPEEGVPEIVQEALLADEMVEIDYVSPGKKRRTHTANPLGLVQNGAITYLVCTFAGTTEPIARLPLHRMKSAKRTYLKATPPAGFSLKHFIDQGGFGFGEKGPIKLKAWVSEMLGGRLAEAKLDKDQKLVPEDEGFELTVTLIDSWRLKWWILSKTGDIVVREPAALRDEIAHTLRAGAACYKK